jgi:hypothetical protein
LVFQSRVYMDRFFAMYGNVAAYSDRDLFSALDMLVFTRALSTVRYLLHCNSLREEQQPYRL